LKKNILRIVLLVLVFLSVSPSLGVAQSDGPMPFPCPPCSVGSARWQK